MSLNFQRVAPHDNALREQLYHLRYMVYCVECNFEDAQRYPDEMERDEYDPHSVHLVAIYKSRVIGTVRLIMDSPLGFPLEKHCLVDTDKTNFHRNTLAEISRLAVYKSWRCPLVTLGLFREVYRESKRLGIRFWYAAMEQKLERLLKGFHLTFDRIGPMVDYHGPRIPFLGTVSEIEATVAACGPERYAYLMGVFENIAPPLRFSPLRETLSSSAVAFLK